MIISAIYIFAIHKPYYYNSKIHNFGNIGFGGHIHATIAPFTTRTIDMLCYNNINIRNEILVPYTNKKVLDLCCGCGISTKNNGIGIDTSLEMLDIAKRNNKNSKFYIK